MTDTCAGRARSAVAEEEIHRTRHQRPSDSLIISAVLRLYRCGFISSQRASLAHVEVTAAWIAALNSNHSALDPRGWQNIHGRRGDNMLGLQLAGRTAAETPVLVDLG